MTGALSQGDVCLTEARTLRDVFAAQDTAPFRPSQLQGRA